MVCWCFLLATGQQSAFGLKVPQSLCPSMVWVVFLALLGFAIRSKHEMICQELSSFFKTVNIWHIRSINHSNIFKKIRDCISKEGRVLQLHLCRLLSAPPSMVQYESSGSASVTNSTCRCAQHGWAIWTMLLFIYCLYFGMSNLQNVSRCAARTLLATTWSGVLMRKLLVARVCVAGVVQAILYTDAASQLNGW